MSLSPTPIVQPLSLRHAPYVCRACDSCDNLNDERPECVGRARRVRSAEENGGAHRGTHPQLDCHVQRAGGDNNNMHRSGDSLRRTTATHCPSRDKANATPPSRQDPTPDLTPAEPARSFQGWIAPSPQKCRMSDKGNATGPRPHEKSDGTKGRHPNYCGMKRRHGR